MLKDEDHIVKLAKIDATKNILSKKYMGGGFPTIRFLKNGEAFVYKGNRKAEVSSYKFLF